ncbi:MAG TPA: hypothetical protein VKU60_18715, partial [Chloroflexota bacterium]|nr:hypothetical protein [Chloroflexota bacterium]
MLINRYWLLALLAAVGAGLWREQPLLTLAGLFGLLIAGAEVLWQRHCLTGVEYERQLGASRAFWGEELPLTIRLANRKLLPLTWLQAEERVPRELPIDNAQVVAGSWAADWANLRNLLPMLPYEQVTRRYTIQCRHRGLFEFGPGRIESGDLLGYSSRSVSYLDVRQLLVYPKLLELDMSPPAARRI